MTMNKLKFSRLLAGSAYAILSLCVLYIYIINSAPTDGVRCGTPIVGLFLLASLIAGIISLIAGCLGVASQRSAKTPFSIKRLLEYIILFLPFLVGLSFFIFMLCA